MLRVARALGRTPGIRIRTTLLAAHTVPPEFAGDADAYIAHIIAAILPAAPRRKPGGRSGRLRRSHRLLPGANRAPLHRRPIPRPAGQTPRGSAHRRQRRGARRLLRRPFRGPPRIHLARRRPGHGPGRHRGRAASRRLRHGRRHPAAAGARLPRPRRPHGRRHRQQPGQLTPRVAAHGRQSRLLPVPPHAGRSPRRRPPATPPPPSASWAKPARWRWANAPTWRSGRSAIHASWRIGWADCGLHWSCRGEGQFRLRAGWTVPRAGRRIRPADPPEPPNPRLL